MNEEASSQLRAHGIVLLRNFFPTNQLTAWKDAATRCFDAIASAAIPPAAYQFNPYSHSVLVAALADFGARSEDWMAPVSAPVLRQLFCEVLGDECECRAEQCWVRKKFALGHEPSTQYHLQTWHQDGALDVHFPPQPGPVIPMTQLLTCWIPLNACGVNSPGLQFVRGPQQHLLHYTELGDVDLRKRFEPERFWAPELQLGDALIFLNSVLHRTYTTPAMTRHRLSVEYRVFPL